MLTFLDERELFDVDQVTPSVLDSYQRHLYHQKKENGLPLSFRTQAQRMIPVKGLFAWLTRAGDLPYDPAISLVLPKVERRVPEAVLSVEEVEAVLSGPDTTTALGLRDRAILEVFYSTAIRRAELLHLRVADIDHARRTFSCARARARATASCRSASAPATGCSATSTRHGPNSNEAGRTRRCS